MTIVLRIQRLEQRMDQLEKDVAEEREGLEQSFKQLEQSFRDGLAAILAAADPAAMAEAQRRVDEDP